MAKELQPQLLEVCYDVFVVQVGIGGKSIIS